MLDDRFPHSAVNRFCITIDQSKIAENLQGRYGRLKTTFLTQPYFPHGIATLFIAFRYGSYQGMIRPELYREDTACVDQRSRILSRVYA